MGLTKAKSQTATTNTTMISHQEATASSHEPEQPILLATGQLGNGYITPRGMGSKPCNRELFLTRDNTMQSSNRSLLKQVEVLG